MKKTSAAISVIVYIALLAVVAGAIALAFAFVNNGQQNFYVQYGNEKIVNEKKDLILDKNVCYVFYCSTVTGQTVDYDVQIFLNVKNIDGFDFSVDGVRKSFRSDMAEYDCGTIFHVAKYDTHFVLSVPDALTLQRIIQTKYADKTVSDVPEHAAWENNSFILTVTDSIERTKTQIYFC